MNSVITDSVWNYEWNRIYKHYFFLEIGLKYTFPVAILKISLLYSWIWFSCSNFIWVRTYFFIFFLVWNHKIYHHQMIRLHCNENAMHSHLFIDAMKWHWAACLEIASKMLLLVLFLEKECHWRTKRIDVISLYWWIRDLCNLWYVFVYLDPETRLKR